MPAGYEFLGTMRVNRVMNALQDVREAPQELLALRRTAITPAMEGEIVARYLQRVLVADLIADDSAGVVYKTGKLQFESNAVPNLKIGVNFTQAELAQISAIVANPGLVDDPLFTALLMKKVGSLLLGIRQRMEQLIVAMWCDGFSYARLGINLTGITWGMPADLKVTVANFWTDATNGTPVNDMLGVKLIGSLKYGIDFDRVTMSTQAFRYMVATAEFQAKARQFLAPNVSYVNLATANLTQQRQLAGNVLGMQIELYDARFWEQDANGLNTSIPYLPINKVVLSNSGNDNNDAVMDFANAPTTESQVAGLMPNGGPGGAMGAIAGGLRGPIAFSFIPPDLNPPNITLWGVARGFPRKMLLQSTACLTVGAFTDAIPTVGDVF